MNIFLQLNAGDYVQLAGAVSSTTVTLDTIAADLALPRPATPAVILTAYPVSFNSSSSAYVSSQTQGSATISHYANSTANKTYGYILVG
jgi:hypothetical protein